MLIFRALMSVLNATRKLLWSRAHNACAICKDPLTVDADSAELPGVVLGEEAHIIARRADGPRGRDGDRSGLDDYDNIILLCAADHKRIDAQPDVFTAEHLRNLKSKHEQWAAKKFAGQPYQEPIRLVRTVEEDSVPYIEVTSGAALWSLIDRTHSRHMATVQGDVSAAAASASDLLLDASSEWADISDEVAANGFSAIREAQASLQELLDDVISHDLFVIGRRMMRMLVGGGAEPAPWPIVQLVVLTSKQAEEMRV